MTRMQPCNTPFTPYNRFDNLLYRVNKHPTDCQTGCQTGLTTVLNEHTVSSTRWSNRLYNRFDDRLYRVNKHPTDCQTGCTTWFDNRVDRTATVRSTGCQTGLYNRFDNWLYTWYSRLSNGFDNRLNVCIHDTTGSQTGLTTGLTTGCIVYTHIYLVVKPIDNRLYRVNGA